MRVFKQPNSLQLLRAWIRKLVPLYTNKDSGQSE